LDARLAALILADMHIVRYRLDSMARRQQRRWERLRDGGDIGSMTTETGYVIDGDLIDDNSDYAASVPILEHL
jgi:hypothetical protein